MELTLESPVQYVPRIGPAMASRLARLGIFTVNDLLWYPPFRYNDFSVTSPIGQIQPGVTVTVRGEVKSLVNLTTKHGKKMQVATVFDNTGKMEIVWFNQPYLLSIIRPGDTLNIAGPVQFFARKIAMISPDYETVPDQTSDESLHTGRLVPVYPETEGVSSKWLRGRIAYLLKAGFANQEDYLPDEIKRGFGLTDLPAALRGMHFPDSVQTAQNAKYRLSFDELFLLQLVSQQLKHEWETNQTAPSISISATNLDAFISLLPFRLTSDQNRTLAAILADLKRDYPMNRLLEGDVGAGKTVVAAVAMYSAHLSGWQTVLMAPTQILAQQHYQTISALFKPFNIPIELVTADTKRKPENDISKQKNKQSEIFTDLSKPITETQVSSGNRKHPSIFIGTHALLSESTRFGNVGLVVIDEQQRFGVAQRTLLKNKGSGQKIPHLLTMTATPIPRTIALAVWGNLDLSVINEMPEGRRVIKTWVVPQEKREGAYKWIEKEIRTNKSQVFVVCPLIEDSESLISVKSVTREFARLKKDVFPEFRLALLHGRLKAKEKTDILEGFRRGKFDILVTTPVVEVGIDIPDATIMLIEGSDRFGLSQLHQLRGRVGRRKQQAYCLLFTDSVDPTSIKRLKALETVHNGPELAEIDLAIRGPGELFGTRQHGLPHLKFADIMNMDLVEKTHEAAGSLISGDPDLSGFLLLREKLEKSKITAVSQD